MNCAKNTTLLSDFHDGLLSDIDSARVRTHLMLCRSCREVFHDLELIISTAAELRDENSVTYPQEKAGWQRFQSAALNFVDPAGSQQWLRR
jgi:predicted anti-sigma-YlaC factor YlaD